MTDPAGADPLGAFPTVRLRRNRRAPWIRALVREHALRVDHLIWPVFVQESPGRTEIESMPGVYRYGPDTIGDAVAHAESLGIPAIALFPSVPDEKKTAGCEEAWNPENLVCRSVHSLRAQGSKIGLICDVALDPYNESGQDGLVRDGIVLNDETLEALCKQAVCQAEAGADVQAPSDMMDGRIGAIRSALDAAGHADQSILSYAVKYASAFYGPFRDAVGSSGSLTGDKKTYQMDPANGDEALREAALDLAEGADLLMVKPGLPYLDLVHRLKTTFGVPITAYQVSGEYSMLVAASERGWLDRAKVVDEALTGFVRAGADAVLTYFAVEVAERLRQQGS